VELAVLFGVRKTLRKAEHDADITKAAEASSKKEKRKAARRAQKGRKGQENEEKADTKEDDDIPNSNPPAYDLEGYVADPPREHVPTVDSRST
jgi:hypothetical protein